MAHSIQHAGTYTYPAQSTKKSFITNFFAWCANEDAEHHFMWTGIALLGQGAVLFPVTMFVMFATGASFWMLLAPITSLSMVVVPNLAGLKTKYTLPIFILSIIINVLAIIAAIL